MPCHDVIAEKGRSKVKGRFRQGRRPAFALIGNPNAGKTALFNALTGLRTRTANYAGTTVERRIGLLDLEGRYVEIIDLPGMYSLAAATPEERIARSVLMGEQADTPKPDGVILILDADNLGRNLFLTSQIRELDLPVIVVLNMVDIAARHGIHVDPAKLSEELRCPVVPMVAKTGQGIESLREKLQLWIERDDPTPLPLAMPASGCSCKSMCGCPYKTRFAWADTVVAKTVSAPRVAPSRWTERIDKALAHPVIGVGMFLLVMLSVFYLIFNVATIPMDLIDGMFARVGGWAAALIPPGDVQSLVVDGIIGGVGGILVFLPQICILFFFLALLEDSGYLARAAFVMDRLMGRVGLPGTAFVPLLSAHACAIPAIMATRVIRDRRDRLVTILVAPLMTCSARIPVYAMVTALLFPQSPILASLVFTGAYALGIAAALIMAYVFGRTILPGKSRPLVMELPGYKVPKLQTVLWYTFDRAKVFVQQAGTIILLISIILWAMATYPKTPAPVEANALRNTATQLVAQGEKEQAEQLEMQAADLESQNSLAHSFAGQLGHLVEPIVRPLGYDWQIGIGIISSFAAREVIVSTLAIVYGVGSNAEDEKGLQQTLRKAKRKDGSPVFTTATSLSLLVFYVLAMQCLPTQVVTRRETGTWKWAALQFGYMTMLAYVAALVTFQGLRLLGVA
ncbi:MAG: ferrous iron transport protein B [Verrucomicrobia bacterium]|nr:ferrous iron transport protein B [Verrucomicrobiota bacterium]